MTIEDIIQGHLDRIATLNGFLRLAFLGRNDEESAVACRVRRRLIAELDEMIFLEREALAADRSYLKRTTESERAHDESQDLGWDDDDDFSEIFETVVLLDTAPLRTDEGLAYDYAARRWYHVEESYPKRVALTDEDLGDLAALIRRIEEAFDISFTVDRYLWTEEAWAIWHEAQAE